jgi:deoxycytidylate deaminase
MEICAKKILQCEINHILLEFKYHHNYHWMSDSEQHQWDASKEVLGIHQICHLIEIVYMVQ